MAARVGSSGSGVFHATISQAPVTDWLYYGEGERRGRGGLYTAWFLAKNGKI